MKQSQAKTEEQQNLGEADLEDYIVGLQRQKTLTKAKNNSSKMILRSSKQSLKDKKNISGSQNISRATGTKSEKKSKS